MNYMKQVAQMLGVELEEEFKVDCYSRKFKITDSGFYWYLEEIDSWHSIWSIALDLLIGKSQIIKLPKPILDDEEKKYLSRIIKPWRDKAKFIIKRKCDEDEYITIIFSEYYTECEMPFPIFETGTMYKGMEVYKEYSLEDLGL